MSQFTIFFKNGFLTLLFLVCCLVITGCGQKSMSGGFSYDRAGDYEQEEMVQASPKSYMPRTERGAGQRQPEIDQQTLQPQRSNKRMIYYQGYLRLLVSRPADVINAAVELASSCGGYVERMDRMSVTIRVPVADFDSIYKKAIELGDVLKKRITAQDITQSFRDNNLRLKIAKATRERLVELLAKATEEEEKLKILKEIQRLSEEIEQFESRLHILSTLANYSKLTIELEKRKSFLERKNDDIAEFRWIKRLSPFKAVYLQQKGRLELSVPANMVLLEKERQWLVESADGAVMRTSRIVNTPSGDTDFWLEAIRVRLEKEFSQVKIQTAGAFKVLRMVGRSEDPYIYLIGISADGKKKYMDLIEVYYPSQAHEERYGKSVLTSVAGGAK
ncbi:MAG: DUF4349 domain-containing protein [Desulfobulbaceae bacterium]|nr:DUF4349 domain-containing protein [Desulfobulbaceae bacterium]